MPTSIQEITARDFAPQRAVVSRSWLSQSQQERGFGTEMRQVILMFAFAHLNATAAETSALEWNAASSRASRRCGSRQVRCRKSHDQTRGRDGADRNGRGSSTSPANRDSDDERTPAHILSDSTSTAEIELRVAGAESIRLDRILRVIGVEDAGSTARRDRPMRRPGSFRSSRRQPHDRPG